MRAIGPGEITRITGEQTASMNDTFVVGVLTETVDTAGRLTKSYVDSAPHAGSLMNPSGKFAAVVDKIITEYDALLRTDVELVNLSDRITFVAKNGDPLPNEVYYAATDAIQYRTMILYALKRTAPA